MKKFLLVAGLALLGILLAGCTLEYDTVIQTDQSGTFSLGVGMTTEEISMYQSMGSTSTSVCDDIFSSDTSDIPTNSSVRQETKGTDTWCYIDIPFANIEELKSIYTEEGLTINRLEIVDGTFYYDVVYDLGDQSDLEDMGGYVLFIWTVTVPGTIQSHNANSVSGHTLTWQIENGGVLSMQATSSMSGTPTWIWWVVGALACLCILVVVIAGVVLIIVLVKKKKEKETKAAVG